MRWSKSDRASEREKDSLLEGLKKLMFDISDQNLKNIETMVTSLKIDGVKDVVETGVVVTDTRTAKIVKLAKVPSWTKGLRLEVYSKQVNTWIKINKDVFPKFKYQDLIESLKVNKEIKNLPRFVGDNVLTVLQEVKDQTIERVLEVLKIKYRR